MATYNLTITSDADDGEEGASWNDKTDEGYYPGEIFRVGADTPPFHGAVRFVSTGIPQGSTITSATLTMFVRGVVSLDGANSIITVTGDDVDNSAALSSGHMPSTGWTDTSATAVLDGTSFVAGNDVVFDVATIVQEIVSRGSFGGNIAFKFVASGSDAYFLVRFADYDADTSLTKARLQVVTAAGGVLSRILLLGVG